MSQLQRKSLTSMVLFSLISGLVVGIFFNQFPRDSFVHSYLVQGLFHILGSIFIATLKMLVVPLVFVSLVCGVQGLENVGQLGKLGIKTITLYLLTTAFAVTLAISFALVLTPGVGFNLPSSIIFSTQDAPNIGQVFIDLIPSNPIQAAAEGNMLQIIIFALLFGVASFLVKEESLPVRHFFNSLNSIIMKMISILMYIAPLGVFALIAKVFAVEGLAALQPLLLYFSTVILALLVHLFFTYGLLIKFFTDLNPVTFFKQLKDIMTFAFSTASSNATIPITLKTVTEKLNVPKSTAAFTIPLGATINMDGTAIMQGVATVFIAQAYNISLTAQDYIYVILTATLASIGTAGVPGVGLITLAMVLKQVNLPVEGIALIMGVDRLLDMLRTVVNVIGDVTVTCLVSTTPQSSLLSSPKGQNQTLENY